MNKYKLQLEDGVIDFSGEKITHEDGVTDHDLNEALPYTCRQVWKDKKPEKFLKFMEANFPDRETLETVLYFLSLIPARETDFRYCGVFYGGYATGKTATIEVMRGVLPGFFENIPGECLLFRHNQALSYFPDIDGKGAGVITEVIPNKQINTLLVKSLTGGDTITSRALYQPPKTYVPTAQIIICTNKTIDFGNNDEAMDARLLVIPFSQKHERGSPQTKTFSEIFNDLKDEFPSIVRLLIEYYIRLKNEHRGVIPQSAECLKQKRHFLHMDPPHYGFCKRCNRHILDLPKEGCCPYCGEVLMGPLRAETPPEALCTTL